MFLKKFFVTFIFIISLASSLFAQQAVFNFTDEAVLNRLKKDQTILASDSFLGREAGTAGEIMARDYIVNQFTSIGIKPYFGDTSFLEPFNYYGSIDYGSENNLVINNISFKFKNDFYPLSLSASKIISGELIKTGYGICAPDKGYDSYKDLSGLQGKIFVIDLSFPEKLKFDTTSKKYAGIKSRVKAAIDRGAVGIIFINTDKNFKNPPKQLYQTRDTTTIPVIFVTGKAFKLIMDGTKCEAKIQVSLNRNAISICYNVAGYIDNKAQTTVVVGGHYDHLGMGGEGSRSTGPPAIHNGADDNASGTTGMLELARYFLASNKKNNNYIFIGFSAEEKGLVGSYRFIKSDAFRKANVNYMINLDMIGRLRKHLILFGTGTSPAWNKAIKKSNGKQIKIKKIKSGFGGSDHQSFIDNGIPAVFVFTGLHPDYHTPADKIEKINFEGEIKIVKFVEHLIETMDNKGNITFTQPSFLQMLQGIRYFL
jgi:aminopeptidase YwaD